MFLANISRRSQKIRCPIGRRLCEENCQINLFDRPVTLAGVIDGEFLAGDMAVEMEHVAEFVVVEAELAVGVRLADGGVRPMVKGGLAVCNSVRSGRFLELGNLPSVGVVVVDVAAEPFRLEVGVFHRIGIGGVRSWTAGAGRSRVTDGGADEQFVFARIDGAEIRPPHEPAILAGILVHVDKRNIAGVVILIHGMGETHLLEIACAGDGLSLFTGLGKGGQQHGGQNRNDGDDDQQFNEREGDHSFDFVHCCFPLVDDSLKIINLILNS